MNNNTDSTPSDKDKNNKEDLVPSSSSGPLKRKDLCSMLSCPDMSMGVIFSPLNP